MVGESLIGHPTLGLESRITALEHRQKCLATIVPEQDEPDEKARRSSHRKADGEPDRANPENEDWHCGNSGDRATDPAAGEPVTCNAPR